MGEIVFAFLSRHFMNDLKLKAFRLILLFPGNKSEDVANPYRVRVRIRRIRVYSRQNGEPLSTPAYKGFNRMACTYGSF
jgi:hypothetical protein